MAGWRRLVTRRSSHTTLDGALLAPSLHTMATNTSHGPRNRFGWPRGPKFLSIASGGRVVLLRHRQERNERPETLWRTGGGAIQRTESDTRRLTSPVYT